MNKIKPRNPITRRTGIDRRWIHSANHQPERRRNRDRRTVRTRSFLESFEANGVAENTEPFPEIDIQASRPDENLADVPFEEKGFSESREAVFKRVASEDG